MTIDLSLSVESPAVSSDNPMISTIMLSLVAVKTGIPEGAFLFSESSVEHLADNYENTQNDERHPLVNLQFSVLEFDC